MNLVLAADTLGIVLIILIVLFIVLYGVYWSQKKKKVDAGTQEATEEEPSGSEESE